MVYFMVLGSSTDRWRELLSSGVSLAEGWSEPFRQKAGFFALRTRAANHTRPSSSNIGLWLLVLAFQITSSPQYADGMIGLAFAWLARAILVPFIAGASKAVTVFLTGSRMGIASVLNSAEP